MEERATFDILAEPVGDLYRELLHFAVGECKTALLVVDNRPPFSPLSEHGSAVMSQLGPFLRSKDESHKWPGTELGPGADPVSVYRYDYGPECAEVLKQATDSLYAWLQPELPQDPCLLRADGSEWLVTIAHEHASCLCLSSEEHTRLVNAIPQIGPRLRDARRREESDPAGRAVMGFLAAWNPYDYYGDSWVEADLWPEADAILCALSSREVQSKAELAIYIADMYYRWYGGVDELGEKHVFTPAICAVPARSIWAWWKSRKGGAEPE